MKYCQNCGCENIETGKFCINCGQRFDKITPVTPVEHVAHVAPSHSYAINAPVTDNTHPSSYSSQYPLHTSPKQIYPITEEFSDLRISHGLQNFIKASTSFKKF